MEEKFSVITIPSLNSMEAVTVSVSTPCYPSLEAISVYSPRGDISPEEILQSCSRSQPFIIGGDFNSHHHMWESNTIPNTGGNSIWKTLMELPDIALLTPKDLCTRIDPSTNKQSTIDLTFTSAMLSLNTTVSSGHCMGSEHLPILTTFDERTLPNTNRPQRWIFNEEKWLSGINALKTNFAILTCTIWNLRK